MTVQLASLHSSRRRPRLSRGVAAVNSTFSVPSVLRHSELSVLIPSFSFEIRFLTLRPDPLIRCHD